MIDSHVHIRKGKPDPVDLMEKLNTCGLDGAVLISLPPEEGSFSNRLTNLIEWTDDKKELIPFFWIDPMERDYLRQIDKAVESDVSGFKIICDRFYPGNERCIEACRLIASLNKPVLFHSGILWDGKPSSEYCRPVHFESLLTVDGLRFSLAHIGWPWIDEMIAVYGKFLNFRSRNPESKSEMFIDMTPGTPLNYRKRAIFDLLGTGYDVLDNLFFGSDCDANCYNIDWSSKWIETDILIFNELFEKPEWKKKVFRENVLGFITGDRKSTFRGQEPAVF